jgi:hypothetical protein
MEGAPITDIPAATVAEVFKNPRRCSFFIAILL